MVRARTIVTFEQGTAGDVLAFPADPAFVVPPFDAGSFDATGAVLVTESHSGNLAARLQDGAGEQVVLATGPNRRDVVGGGGWFKIKSPSTGHAIASIQLYDYDTFAIYGVYVQIVAGALTAFDDISETPIASVATPLDQWLQLQLAPDGAWSLSTDSTTLLSGVVPTPPNGVGQYAFQAQARDTGGITLVDDLWVWIDKKPVVRLYPRDDGRGMSSAPRIHPAPKGRSRVIGGYQ